ncbi:hypothetical protein [Sphingomonas sp. 28-62-11]|uniref:hypothetical protein n=1 Tax=Sphingomonas sp. 28-62-11 TaxID=1970432 RepID=UPI000BC4B7DF|nr:MAG: hypothetical protein B7Y49_01800 [Sphingomonas sp. 28-62-11]
MNKSIAIGCIIALTALSGCASLEQAPLVYSSTNQIGVIVSGGKAESPTPSIMIGYNGVDVAFVPVAVAKHCERKASKSNTTKRCKEIDPDIKGIWGTNKKSGQSTSDDAKIDRLQLDIAAINQENERLRDSIKDKERDIKDIEKIPALENEKSQLETVSGDAEGAASPANANPVRLAEIEVELKRLNALKNQNLLQKKADITTNITQNAEKANALLQDLRRLEARVDTAKNDDKRDALSVYGTFNGNANGDSQKGAGLTVGKTFSTGIAAQNISQGLLEGGVAIATAQCFRVAKEVLAMVKPEERTADMVRAAMDNCALPTTSRP